MTAVPEPFDIDQVDIDQVDARPRGRRLLPRFLVAFLLGLLAVLAVGVGALYAYDQRYQDRVLPGVHVGAIDLSGLTAGEAAARLHETYDALATGTIVLVAGDREIRLPYTRASRAADIDGMVARALSVGRAGTLAERVIANVRTAVRGVDVQPSVGFDREALTHTLVVLAAAEHVGPVNATITRTNTGFTVAPSVTGVEVDPTDAIATLMTELGRIDAPDRIRVDLHVAELPPAITTEEAKIAVAAADRIAADVRIVDGNDSWTISAASIRSWLSFRTTADGTIAPVVDQAKVKKALATVAKAVTRSAANASFTIVNGRVGSVIPARNGRSLDTDATAAKIDELLAARAAGGPTTAVKAILRETEPSVTTAEATAVAPKIREISRWTTYFFITERNHFGANIWIPALDIDGTVVGPGETFDFWDAVGPVTRSRGYGDGGAIINGKTEPQGALAGGICSCSTTLFNAALRAGFEMLDRRNHYYYIDRYPTGLDATVFKSGSGSVQTMSWRNDTQYPVLIRGFKIRADGKGYVRFVLYSVPNGRQVAIADPIIKNVRPASDTIVYTSSLPAGSSERVEYPVNGMDVWRTVTVYENGKVLRRTTYYSHYSRITGVTLIGRAPAVAN
jgi:vancomycin resistance protein YoaR